MAKIFFFFARVFISDLNHEYKDITCSVMQQPLVIKDIEIGDGCFVGYGVCVLPGVHLGKHCCIGTNAVVTKNIPDYCVAVGNPAVVIKQYDFDKHEWKKIGGIIKLYRRGVNKKAFSCTRKVA